VNFAPKKAGILNSNKFADAEGTANVKACKTVASLILVRQRGVPGLQTGGTPADS